MNGAYLISEERKRQIEIICKKQYNTLNQIKKYG